MLPKSGQCGLFVYQEETNLQMLLSGLSSKDGRVMENERGRYYVGHLGITHGTSRQKEKSEITHLNSRIANSSCLTRPLPTQVRESSRSQSQWWQGKQATIPSTQVVEESPVRFLLS
jgi:hypothetical protein